MRTKALSMLVILTLVVLLPGCYEDETKPTPVYYGIIDGIHNPLRQPGTIWIVDGWHSEDQPEPFDGIEIQLSQELYQHLGGIHARCQDVVKVWWQQGPDAWPMAASTPYGACRPDRALHFDVAILAADGVHPSLYVIFS